MGAKRKEKNYRAGYEVALAWLVAIKNDNRAGRGEICYDEFAYKRREKEFKRAAQRALKEMRQALTGDSPTNNG